MAVKVELKIYIQMCAITVIVGIEIECLKNTELKFVISNMFQTYPNNIPGK